ncbi:antibiotic biosynthesis monooxygenase [Seongchinamella unica]|uniref:Antibiotic biosynthesis monooxygenase n=1 Tax=Seongchinamella unica TaxID=2547392 RepID=A0A4R5LU73_9GAMM|nr:putative quinol monooxygenase [Seongchinamella unica]TDG14857.1 antibiotic biosynthesis monooxygenase [Seongchinamella unica]
MTVIIAGTLDIPGGERDQALAEAADLIGETRSQEGCQHYVWSADPVSATRVYVYEYWTSVESLAAHLAGPFYSRMLELLGKYPTQNVQISKFRIDLEEPVYDPQGRPRADFFTE